MAGLVATAEIDISAPPDQVWRALTDPDQIRRYFLGAEVTTDWQPGSPITWKGTYEGREFEDKGQVLDIEPCRHVKMTHFSPLSGHPDSPENYHTLTYDLEERGHATHVTLTQDNNSTPEEVEHSASVWESMLASLKRTVESS